MRYILRYKHGRKICGNQAHERHVVGDALIHIHEQYESILHSTDSSWYTSPMVGACEGDCSRAANALSSCQRPRARGKLHSPLLLADTPVAAGPRVPQGSDDEARDTAEEAQVAGVGTCSHGDAEVRDDKDSKFAQVEANEAAAANNEVDTTVAAKSVPSTDSQVGVHVHWHRSDLWRQSSLPQDMQMQAHGQACIASARTWCRCIRGFSFALPFLYFPFECMYRSSLGTCLFVTHVLTLRDARVASS